MTRSRSRIRPTASLKRSDRPMSTSPSEAIRRSGLAVHEAQRLLSVATGLDRTSLILSESVSVAAMETFAALVRQRASGVPLQHLEGTVQFGPLELRCDARALIPRPETEELWELVISLAVSPSVVVDLCTGGGCLALAFKHAFPEARVIGTDLSVDALSLAQENVLATGLAVGLFRGDLFDALPDDLHGAIDVLVSNPPYLAASELDGLEAEVAVHDPAMALVAGPDGDEFLVRLAADVGDWLTPGGVVAVEIGASQGLRAMELFADLSPELRRDLDGRDRFLVGRVPE